MDRADAVALVERGLVRSWVRQVGWVPRSEVRRLGGITVVLSGVRDQTQQVALVDGPVDDPEASVIAAEVCIERAGWRPAFDLAEGAHPDIEAILESRGFRVVVTRPAMVGTTARELAPLPEGVAIELAVSTQRDAVVELQTEAFDMPVETARGLVASAMFADPEAAVLVARDERAPVTPVVGSVTVHLDDPAAILGAAVRPSHRRRGIGAALTTAALRLAAGHDSGLAWLQATPDGEPIYRRLGFDEVARFSVWLR